MMKKLPDFFEKNLHEFSSIPITPDAKLTSLRKGLLNYFETYKISNRSYAYLQETPFGVTITHQRSHDFLIRYFASITFTHLYFEHYLTEIFESTSPALSRLSKVKEMDLIQALTGNISLINISNKSNIDYSLLLKRICELIKQNNNLPSSLQIDSKYHFLIKHIQTLEILAILRNDIVHSGKKFLTRYSYEFFFANKILPLVRETLKIQTPTPYIERDLYCGRNVIDEIIKSKLTEDFSDANNLHFLEVELNRINHFKELGRASYNNPIDMKERVSSIEQKELIEEAINKKQRSKGRQIARLQKEYFGHYKTHICPCCGTESLNTFDYWEIAFKRKVRVETAECFVCSYQIRSNIGEPKKFDILNEDLFEFVIK